MEIVQYFGKEYQRGPDDLLYRKEMIEDVLYMVPMFISRTGSGWHLQVRRKSLGRVNVKCSDKSLSLNGVNSIQETLDAFVSRVKREYTHVYRVVYDECRKEGKVKNVKFSRAVKVPGLRLKVLYSSKMPMVRAPRVSISANSVGMRNKIPGSEANLNFFKITEDIYNLHIEKALSYRYSAEDIHPALRKCKLENVVSEIESKWSMHDIDSSAAQMIETSEMIIVKMNPQFSNGYPERMEFKYGNFVSNKTAQRIALLYKKHLASKLNQ